jgi:Ca2+-binding RTX toxin-like protein
MTMSSASSPRRSPLQRRQSLNLPLLALIVATLVMCAVVGLGTASSPAVGQTRAPEGAGFELNASDLAFILKQIKIAEQHAGPNGKLLGTGADQVSTPRLPYGLRTVNGTFNNLVETPNQSLFGSADQPFPRLLAPFFPSADAASQDYDGPGPAQVGTPTSYTQTRGIVEDSEPRTASNLIVDQTASNPAAVDAATKAPHRDPTTGEVDASGTLTIENTAPDEGLSAPYNSWFTLFGQFFDHGLDLTTKGNSGTVLVPLRADDPLIVGPDGEAGTADDPANPPPPSQRFMVLTRATNLPGPDGQMGTADDVREHTNTTTAHVDQNQTYTSHPAHQAFLREYERNAAGRPVSSGKVLDLTATQGGVANWGQIKAQARDMLGIELRDADVLNVPLLATDPYGRFLPAANGYAQLVVNGQLVAGDPAANGGLGVSTVGAARTNHAFLDDIAHHAQPVGDHDRDPSTPQQALTPDADGGTTDDRVASTYDNEMLDAHFITGDGRGNENIGLTAVHTVFHAEHNRLTGHIKDVVLAGADLAVVNEWLASPATAVPADKDSVKWNGERIFQAAKFVTEMQYQHLVFEEFARKVQPQVNIFAGYHTEIDPAIVAEFAHVVYRFGHSMLTETVERTNADESRSDIPLLDAFLNPQSFRGASDQLTPDQATGSIAMGMTRQVGWEIDEFVTEALRNRLLGLPLDLATLNMARGRDTGVPGLNAARRKFFATTGNAALEPYTSWGDFGLGLRTPTSLQNFIAAYGTHPSISEATTLKAKRQAAELLVGGPETYPAEHATPAPADSAAFINGTGAWANAADGKTRTGLEDVDFWVGGLAEKQQPFGGLLGNTFSYVFETQMENLQDGDRFYYLTRTAGLNLLTQLEGNSFSELIERNSNAEGLPADAFSALDYVFKLALQSDGTVVVKDDPRSPLVDESKLVLREPDGTFRFASGTPLVDGTEHVLFFGTQNDEKIRSGAGDDTLKGNDGNDRLSGGAGNDNSIGGKGDDIQVDSFGDDVTKGGAGNDVISSGQGFDLNMGGRDKDFIIGGSDPTETLAGAGDDMVIAGGSSDTVFGDDGDDWIQGGNQADLLQGDNGAPFQNDPNKPGNDVIIGDGGDDDYDAEGGDDVMVAGPGIERNEGMFGFDWVTYKNDPQPGDADMNFTGLLPPEEDTLRDRFDAVEALSGWKHDDKLRGAAVDPANVAGHRLTTAGVALIPGLQAVLGTPVAGPANTTQFTDGNILLGGAGNDTIQGRAGNDRIDGDKWLNVQLQAGTAAPVDSLTSLQADVLAGTVNPGTIAIRRSIESITTGATDVDTAVFSVRGPTMTRSSRPTARS